MARSAWRLAGYRVEELLGAGSSGEVWRARVNATGAAVALKRIWLSDRSQRKAALSEAAMLSSLDHPHLMRVHELRHIDDDAIVLVLDLASGGSLASLLSRRGRLTVGEVITAIAPIGAALAYAHHSGVVHGDVSGANILFTEVGLPLLADLGVARLLGDSAPVRTTPAYADPAVAGGGLPGPASDVFMLAGVALHALTGSPPWQGIAPSEMLEAAASGDQPDFAARLAAARVPSTTADIVARALTIEPALRATAADFALDLRHSGEPVAVELSAGRARLAPTHRHAGGSGGGRSGSWPVEPVEPVEPVAAGAAPIEDVPAVPFTGEQPLTYGARAPSPFAGPVSARHQAQGRARGRARATVGLAVGVLLAAATAASIVLWPFGNGGPRRPATAVRPATAASAARSVAPVDAASPRSSAPPARARAAPLDPARARAVLAELDGTRAAAFATRNPALLATVYASPSLLARDSALVTSIVPAGCGLRGVHTRYSGLVITTRSSERARLRVRSALAASTLVCGGTPAGRAIGAAAVQMQVDLLRYGSRYRIAALRRV